MNCARLGGRCMPPGRNELRPYIHTRSSHKIGSINGRLCKNRTHTPKRLKVRILVPNVLYYI